MPMLGPPTRADHDCRASGGSWWVPPRRVASIRVSRRTLVTFPTITFRDDVVGFAELDNSKRHGIGGEAAVIVTSAGCGVFGADSQNLGISATQQFGTKLRDQSRVLVFSAC